MALFDILGEMLKRVANKNRTDESVKTADDRVFEDLGKKMEEVEAIPTSVKTRADILREYREKVLQAQQENEADPVVETADRSVYDDLMRELEQMREQDEMGRRSDVLEQSRGPSSLPPLTGSPSRPTRAMESQAMTNSMGGSLALRSAPDMGASKSDFRVPDKSLLRILEYSDNAIMLDGKRSRFVLVEYQGRQGWILESYLNFN